MRNFCRVYVYGTTDWRTSGPTSLSKYVIVLFSECSIGREIQAIMNGLLSYKISPETGILQGSFLSQLFVLMYVNELPKPHHRENSKFQFADDTALWSANKNAQFAAKLLQKDIRKLAKRCTKWRIKLNHEETKDITFFRLHLARHSERVLKMYSWSLKICPLFSSESSRHHFLTISSLFKTL